MFDNERNAGWRFHDPVPKLQLGNRALLRIGMFQSKVERRNKRIFGLLPNNQSLDSNTYNYVFSFNGSGYKFP
jgi:hypothetical protein